MAFNANEHMMKLKGKDYLQVMWRLVWFREEHPDWGLDTILLESDENHAVFTAKITDNEGRSICSGHGSESKKDFGDFLEKAETKAVGRALAMLGYGTQFAADELDEGERIVDSPVDRQKNEIGPACPDCGKPITSVKRKDGSMWAVSDMMAYSTTRYGRALCADCMKAAEKAKAYAIREDGTDAF